MERLAAALIALTIGFPAAAAPGRSRARAAEVALADGFPKLTDAERSLATVPFAPGAHAVVLQDVLQNRWDAISKDIRYMRIDHHRRLKVFTPEGVARYATWGLELIGDQELQKVEGRTVLPDGRIVPAKVTREAVEAKRAAVTVGFAEVAPGAILDLRVTRSRPALFSLHRPVQEEIPVLNSRFVMVPPAGLDFSMVVNNLDPSAVEVAEFRSAFGDGMAYTLRDVPPLPREANLPPEEDVKVALYFVPRALDERVHTLTMRDVAAHFDFATTWEAWRRSATELWEPWLHGQATAVTALVREAVPRSGTSWERAEAVRLALRDVEVEDVPRDEHVYIPQRRAPDPVLQDGKGLRADVAGLHVAALRAAGLTAHLAATRRRSAGAMAPDLVIPQQFDDVLVRVETERGPVLYNPGEDLPVGVLPKDNRNVWVMPLDGAALAPVPVTDFVAADHRIVRRVTGGLDRDGTFQGSIEETRYGLAAYELRLRLRGLEGGARCEAVQEHLRQSIDGLEVSDCSTEDGPKAGASIPFLKVVSTCRAQGLARRDGHRLRLDLSRFWRVDRSEWAPETRRAPVSLGGAFDDSDTMTIQLPPGIQEVVLPPAVSLPLGNVGTFSLQHQRIGSKIVRKRQTVLEQYAFAPEGWPTLRAWALRTADALEAPAEVVLAAP